MLRKSRATCYRNNFTIKEHPLLDKHYLYEYIHMYIYTSKVRHARQTEIPT